MSVFTGMPFVRILPSFCIGIVVAFYELVDSAVVYSLLIFIGIGILIIRSFKNKAYTLRHLRGMLIFLLFFCLGFLITLTKNDETHWQSYDDSNTIYRASIIDINTKN